MNCWTLARVLAGDRYLSPRIPRTSHDVGLAAVHFGLWRLTPREQQVVRLIGEGAGPAEVAAELGLSRSTISYHLKHVMRNLGVASMRALRRQAVLIAASEEEADALGSGQPKAARRARTSWPVASGCEPVSENFARECSEVRGPDALLSLGRNVAGP